jgi:hypothetical protein
MSDAFDAGYEAYLLGYYQSCNPYDPKGRMADEWDLGWLQAEEEDREAEEELEDELYEV